MSRRPNKRAAAGAAALFTLTFVVVGCERRAREISFVDGGKVTAGETVVTAADQPAAGGDTAITRDIRRGIVKEDGLSLQAKNVTIVTVDGVVTLRGLVKTDRESAKIEVLAREIPGVKRVENELELDMK